MDLVADCRFENTMNTITFMKSQEPAKAFPYGMAGLLGGVAVVGGVGGAELVSVHDTSGALKGHLSRQSLLGCFLFNLKYLVRRGLPMLY